MDPLQLRLMEKLALKSSLSLEEICGRLQRAFRLPPFEFDSENENAWGSVVVDHVEINVSKPYDPESLESWDGAVPFGFNVGICLTVSKQASPDKDLEWSGKKWVPGWAQTAANVLQTTVIHHRTTGTGFQDLLPKKKYLPK